MTLFACITRFKEEDEKEVSIFDKIILYVYQLRCHFTEFWKAIFNIILGSC